METQRYLLRGNEVVIVSRFNFNDREYIVVSDDDWFKICEQSDLLSLESSYSYKRKKVIENEIIELEKNKESKLVEIKKKAVDDLVLRIKLNSVFGEDAGNYSTFGLIIAEELKKLIK